MNPEFLRNELELAIRDVQLRENTACYWDGMNGSREDADAALTRAIALLNTLYAKIPG